MKGVPPRGAAAVPVRGSPGVGAVPSGNRPLPDLCDGQARVVVGLAIAQQIVLEHGGEIRAESTPGEGATFTISLPTVPEAGDEERP